MANFKNKNRKCFSIIILDPQGNFEGSRLWRNLETAILTGLSQSFPFYLQEYELTPTQEYAITEDGEAVPRKIGKLLYE